MPLAGGLFADLVDGALDGTLAVSETAAFVVSSDGATVYANQEVDGGACRCAAGASLLFLPSPYYSSGFISVRAGCNASFYGPSVAAAALFSPSQRGNDVALADADGVMELHAAMRALEAS